MLQPTFIINFIYVQIYKNTYRYTKPYETQRNNTKLFFRVLRHTAKQFSRKHFFFVKKPYTLFTKLHETRNTHSVERPLLLLLRHRYWTFEHVNRGRDYISKFLDPIASFVLDRCPWFVQRTVCGSIDFRWMRRLFYAVVRLSGPPWIRKSDCISIYDRL